MLLLLLLFPLSHLLCKVAADGMQHFSLAAAAAAQPRHARSPNTHQQPLTCSAKWRLTACSSSSRAAAGLRHAVTVITSAAAAAAAQLLTCSAKWRLTAYSSSSRAAAAVAAIAAVKS
jgi:hypothetical protein